MFIWGGDAAYLDLGADTVHFDRIETLFFDNAEYDEIVNSMDYKHTQM